MKRPLSRDQARVLEYLHEHRDTEPTTAEIASKIGIADVRRVLAELKELGLVNGPASLLERCVAMLRDFGDMAPEPTASSYSTVIVMLAALLVGADEATIASELGYDLEFVRLTGARLRNAAIWSGDQITDDARKRWDESAVSFWLDAGIGEGLLELAPGKAADGQRLMQLTESGRRFAAALVKRAGDAT